MNETIKNLTKAFIGESQARNRYSFYAKTAKKAGYEQIAEIFKITADNEKQHAKWLFKLINKLKEQSEEDLSEITVQASAPTIFSTTKENLKAAIGGEHHEHSIMYPEFAEIARKEGFKDISVRLLMIAKAEEHHEQRFKKLLKNIEEQTVFNKKEEVYWVCRECGYVHYGTKPPKKCPSCDHPESYFQIKCEEY